MPYFIIQTINPDSLARRYQIVFREKTAPDESELVAGPFDTEAEALKSLALSAGLNHWQLAKILHFAGFETAPRTIMAWAAKGTTPPANVQQIAHFGFTIMAWAAKGTTPPTTRSGRPIPFYRYDQEDKLWKSELPPHLARLVEDFDFLACPRCGEGVFTDDEEGIDLLFMRRPSLTCLSCFLVYEADYYGEEFRP